MDAQITSSMFKSSLGVRHGLKCVVDGDKELYLRSALLVLQNLDVEHPVGQYLVTTCQSFHKRHGNGVKTLLFLIGSLMKTTTLQRQNNIPVSDIVSAMQEGVKQCQKVMEEVKLPLSDIIQSCDECHEKLKPSDKSRHTTEEQLPCGVTGNFSTTSGASSGFLLSTNVTRETKEEQESWQSPADSEVNQLPCATAKDFSTSSGSSSAIPSHIDNMIQLNIKECSPDSEEDLDWFFQDDPINPGHANVNPTNVQGHKSLSYFEKKTKSDFMESLGVLLQSKDQSDDSDFDDCFDDIPVSKSIDLGKSACSVSEKSRLQVNDHSERSVTKLVDVSKTKTNLSSQVILNQGHSGQESLSEEQEDDFDSCFNLKCDDNKTDAGNFCEGRHAEGQHIKGQGQGNTYRSENNEKSSGNQDPASSLEMKLQNILQQKTKTQGHKMVYNSSRHFKSVESTVDFLKLGKLSTNQEALSSSATSPSNKDFQGQSVKSQGQLLENQSNCQETAQSQDEKESLENHREENLPSRDTLNDIDSKTPETGHEEGLGSKIDFLLQTAKSKKVSRAVLQSRHFREIGQKTDSDIDISVEVGGLCVNAEIDSQGQRPGEGKDVTALTCQLSGVDNQGLTMQLHTGSEVKQTGQQSLEVKKQELGIHPQQPQSSEIKCKTLDLLTKPRQSSVAEKVNIDSISSQNNEEIRTCEKTKPNKKDFGVSPDTSINREFDWWAGLRGVARSVSHNDEEMMDILIEAAKSQWRTEGCQDTSQARLSLDLLYCCVSLGPIASPQLVSGVVISTDVTNVPLIYQYRGRQLNTIMVNGDIKSNYHHIGYKRPLDTQKTMTAQGVYRIAHKDRWIESVRNILTKFSIMCLLVRGSICEEVKVMCETFGVIAIENVPYKALHVMCTASITSMTTYLTDVDKTNVCTTVSMDTYTEKWMMGYRTNFVKVMCHNTPVQTCVISHPTTGGGDLLEQDFWRSANILSSLLCSGYVLPGGGRTEQLISEALLTNSGSANEDNTYVPHVLQDMAVVLHDYYTTVCLNTGQGHTAKGQGHTYSLPDKGQGHTDPPSGKGQGLTYSPPDKGQGHTYPLSVKGQGHIDLCFVQNRGHMVPPVKCQNYIDSAAKGHEYSPLKDHGHISIDNAITNERDFQNIQLFTSDEGTSVIYDDYRSKMAGIETACDFVSTVLMCDSYIVTGVDQATDLGQNQNTTQYHSGKFGDVIL